MNLTRIPSRTSTTRICFVAMLCMLLALLSGCAFFNRKNTPALNWVEDNLVPEKNPGRAFAYPVVIPVGAVAITLDALIIHPAGVIDDAADDTRDALWDDFNWHREYMTECAVLPWRTVGTPLVFTGDFFGRAFFDTPDYADRSRREAEKEREFAAEEKKLAEAEKLLMEGKASEALDSLSSWIRRVSDLVKPCNNAMIFFSSRPHTRVADTRFFRFRHTIIIGSEKMPLRQRKNHFWRK
ncbi:MAG: hypothetical protein V2A74_14045 [bacterium]